MREALARGARAAPRTPCWTDALVEARRTRRPQSAGILRRSGRAMRCREIAKGSRRGADMAGMIRSAIRPLLALALMLALLGAEAADARGARACPSSSAPSPARRAPPSGSSQRLGGDVGQPARDRPRLHRPRAGRARSPRLRRAGRDPHASPATRALHALDLAPSPAERRRAPRSTRRRPRSPPTRRPTRSPTRRSRTPPRTPPPVSLEPDPVASGEDAVAGRAGRGRRPDRAGRARRRRRPVPRPRLDGPDPRRAPAPRAAG